MRGRCKRDIDEWQDELNKQKNMQSNLFWFAQSMPPAIFNHFLSKVAGIGSSTLSAE